MQEINNLNKEMVLVFEDVYKRQLILPGGLSHIARNTAVHSILQRRNKSVSYTHLDVYKRQIENRMLKRIFDVIFSLLFLCTLVPIIGLIVGVTIKIDV